MSNASIQENNRERLRCFVMRSEDELIVKCVLCVEIPEKRRRLRPDLWWKDPCRKNLTIAEIGRRNKWQPPRPASDKEE